VNDPRATSSPVEAIDGAPRQTAELTRRSAVRQIGAGLGLAATLSALGLHGVSAHDASPAAGDSDQEAHNKTIVQRWADVIVNQHDLDQLPTIVTEDATDHPSGAQGIAAIRAILEGNLSVTSDHRVDLSAMIAEGDKVAIVGTVSGTHDGSFMGMPATGKQFAVMLIEVLRIEGDKIAERWGLIDWTAFMLQIGLTGMPGMMGPAPATPTT
jgi:steroid delta-isomerase-like uncharacterized protein